MPPPPAQMTITSALEQPLDRPELEDALRLRRRDDAPPPAAIRLEDPALRLAQLSACVLVVHRSDELGRVLERGIVGGPPAPSSAGWRRDARWAAGCRAPARSGSRSSLRSARRACRADRARLIVRRALQRQQAHLRAVAVRQRRAGAWRRRRRAPGAATRTLARWSSAVIGSPAPQQRVTTKRDDDPHGRRQAPAWRRGSP